MLIIFADLFTNLTVLHHSATCSTSSTIYMYVYIGFRFQDWADVAPISFLNRFDPEVGRAGERIVFVENAETGLVEAKEAGSASQGQGEDEDVDEESHLLGI
jgi:hypothetical protein